MAEKEHKVEHQTLSWVLCDVDAKGTNVVSLSKEVRSSVTLAEYFIREWITGSTNQ